MYSHYDQRQSRSSRDFDDEDNIYETTSTTYRSTMSPRITSVQRSRPTGLTAPGVSTRIYQTYSSTGNTNQFGPGLASLVNFPGVPLRSGSNGVNTAIVSINTARQRDKRELENLNDKFAQYVEKVRFLEAHNRKLVMEIDALQNRLRQGPSRIKEMYDIEMIEGNKLIDDIKRDAAAINAKKQQAEKDLLNQTARYNDIKSLREIDRREIDLLQLQIAENEAQIALFRRRMNDLDDESRRYKAEAQRLSSEIGRLQNEIQNELFLKSSCEVEKLALEDDLTNLKHLHEVDLAELRSKSVTNDLDPSQFFRNELSEAIREIRNDYETTIDNRRNDLQNRYSLLINEITIRTQQHDANPLFNEPQRRQVDRLRNELSQVQNQNNQLRNKNRDVLNSIDELRQKIRYLKDDDILAKGKTERDIDEARRRLERVEQTFTDVTAFKTSLEKEIAIYRELLESPNGLRGCADRIVQNAEQKALERPSSLYNYRPDSTKTTKTTSISRTYINTTGSNYSYIDLNPTTSTGTYINEPPPPSSSSYYHTLSNTSRIVPIRDETLRHSSSSDSTIRDDNTRGSIIREYVPQDDSNHHTLPPNRPLASSSSSSSSSQDSLGHTNTGNDNPPTAEYETFEDA